MHITKISMIQRLDFVARRRFRGVRADSASVALGFGVFIARQRYRVDGDENSKP